MNLINRNDADKVIINVIIFSILIRPHPSFLPDVISVYAFDGIIIFISIFESLKKRLTMKSLELAYIILSFVLFLLRSLFAGIDVDSVMAEFKLIYYIFGFCWLRMIIKERDYYNHIYKIIDICFFVNAVIAIIQLFDIPILVNAIHVLYGKVGLRSLWTGYARIYGAFNNPNWFAVYLAIMASIYTIRYLETKQRLYYILRASLIAALLLASGSRSGLLATIIGIVACLLINKRIKPLIYTGISLSLIVFISSVLAQKIPLFEKTFARFTRYFDLLFSSRGSGQFAEVAAESRWGVWQEAWSYYLESPIFGKTMGEMIPHNSYIAFLIRFGAISLISLIPLIVLIFSLLRRRNIRTEIKKMCLSSLIVLLVAMFTGDYLFTTQIMMFEVLILSLSNIEEKILGGNYD